MAGAAATWILSAAFSSRANVAFAGALAAVFGGSMAGPAFLYEAAAAVTRRLLTGFSDRNSTSSSILLLMDLSELCSGTWGPVAGLPAFSWPSLLGDA